MKDPFLLVSHILDAIQKIEQYTLGVDKAEFESNFLIQDAVLRNVTIMGEASSKSPSDFKSRFPQIPWKRIIGMRNRLVHEYFAVDVETVWNVIEKDVSELKSLLSQVLKSKESGN